MTELGWDSCDIIIISRHMPITRASAQVIGGGPEAQGRVGMIAQPDWHSADPFTVLGRPNLFFGVTSVLRTRRSIITRRQKRRK